jgi:hypothetical protein
VSCEGLAPLGASRAAQACSAVAAWGIWCAAQGCANIPPPPPITFKDARPLLVLR